MKNNLLFVFVMTSLLWSCKFMYNEPYIKIENDFVEVHFERLMPKETLEKLKNDLASKNIVLDIIDAKYDGDKLNFLSFTVNYNGRTGAASTFFVQNHPFGFIIDNRAGKPSRFVVGELKK